MAISTVAAENSLPERIILLVSFRTAKTWSQNQNKDTNPYNLYSVNGTKICGYCRASKVSIKF